jgi:hypothetical protein
LLTDEERVKLGESDTEGLMVCEREGDGETESVPEAEGLFEAVTEEELEGEGVDLIFVETYIGPITKEVPPPS